MYAHPNPWFSEIEECFYGDHKDSYAGTLFEPRSKMELSIYECLSSLLNKKDVDQKRKLHWSKWMTSCATTENWTSSHESYLSHAIEFCVNHENKHGWTFSGLPHVSHRWMDKHWVEHLTKLVRRVGRVSVGNKRGPFRLDQVRLHPNSNNQMMDIVHPSWHCSLTKGKSLWIASDYSPQNKRFTSYINNLSLHHVELYRCIEDVIQLALPLFNAVLAQPVFPMYAKEEEAEKKIKFYRRVPFGLQKHFGSAWFDSEKIYMDLVDLKIPEDDKRDEYDL